MNKYVTGIYSGSLLTLASILILARTIWAVSHSLSLNVAIVLLATTCWQFVRVCVAYRNSVPKVRGGDSLLADTLNELIASYNRSSANMALISLAVFIIYHLGWR